MMKAGVRDGGRASGTALPRQSFVARRSTALKDQTMLGYMLLFIIIALVAGYFGFFALAGTAALIAKVLFILAIVFIIARGVMDAVRGRAPL
tara:strand:+ start:2653 stop:2928 length:276 start_codon:yes stop_codon:yes gene_type:complete